MNQLKSEIAKHQQTQKDKTDAKETQLVDSYIQIQSMAQQQKQG
jgi:hypothetical protein